MKRIQTIYLSLILSVLFILAMFHIQFVTAEKRNVNIKRIGKFDDGGRYLGIQLKEPFVYAVDGEQGLEIINITDRENSSLVGKFNPHAGIPQDVFINGSYAFLANSFDGIRIINITDPTNPTIISHYMEVEIQYFPFYEERIKSDSLNIFVKGSIAYIADGEFGVRIINITDPFNPKKVGEYIDDKNGTRSVIVNGSYAYVADGEDGVEILNVSSFSNITRIGHYYDGGKAMGLYFTDPYLYVADYDNGLEILDVSDPTNPFEIGQIHDESGLAINVFVSGDLAFIADNTDGLEVFDISDPTTPVEIGQFYEETGIIGLAKDVVVDDSFIYVAFGIQGLEILTLTISISETTTPSVPETITASVTNGGVSITFGSVLTAISVLILLLRRQRLLELI
ncbi:MAG: LVIVD repeat-containing protein [Promethearchaeota archaeon]